MRIDDQVEASVRECLGAVIARDPGRSAAALRAVVDAGDEAFGASVELLFALDQRLLCDLHEGPVPAHSVASLAESVALMEAWADLDQTSAWRFLMALAQSRDPSEILPPDEAVRVGLIIGAWLLESFRPDGQAWESLLDECLDALEGNLLQGSIA